jgi:hypothetical protein
MNLAPLVILVYNGIYTLTWNDIWPVGVAARQLSASAFFLKKDLKLGNLRL